MLVDDFLPRVASELRLQFVAPLRHGEFGAALVRDRDGQDLVLKAVPSATWARRFAHSAALVERLRARGYPAPLHVATGVSIGASWSLQERLEGDAPQMMTAAHARRLVELAESHAGAAGRQRRWQSVALPAMRSWSADLTSRVETQSVVRELAQVLGACASVGMREGDVIHNDFSHRNYLARGDEVTGVVDWELADVGDWRLDLVTLAYWAALEPAQVSPAAARIILECADGACAADLRALFSTYQTLRHLDFVARLHADRLAATVRAIEARIAPSWRGPIGRGRAHAAA